MEIREYAERILFEPSLAVKLTQVEGLTDDVPGRPVTVPNEPARDPACRLRTPDSGAQPRFPGPAELETDRARGEALHFFANHELMALELMALALLRFVDAPRAWRRSVVATMADEQRHARMYIERMASCGVAMGDIPANDHFWRIGATMADPLTYAAVVGLTLEQANLDFAAAYRRLFDQVGDRETASVLQQVLDDEIHHVRRGLNWLNRLKQPEQDTWQAWQAALPPGLTPAHAKGRVFVVQPRRDAGLDDEFIRRLQVFNRSRARPPTVHWFDADEGDLERMTAADDPVAVDDLRADLDLLPLPMCRQGDVLIVRRAPRLDWLANLQEAGFLAPELIVAPPGQKEADSGHGGDGDVRVGHDRLAEVGTFDALEPRRLGRAAPWRWTPRTRRLAEVMDVSQGQHAWPVEHDKAAEIVRRLKLDLCPELERISNDARPALYLSVLLRVDSATEWTWLGLRRQLVRDDGRHLGSVLGRQDTGLDADLLRFLHGPGRGGRGVERRLRRLAGGVATRLAAASVRGPAALNAIVFRDPRANSLHLDPLRSVNPHGTLAHIGHELDRRVARATRGLWWLAGRHALMRARAATFEELVNRLSALLPDRRDASPGGALRQGVLPTTDPQNARQLMGIAVVATSAERLRGALVEAGLPDPFSA